MEKKENKLELRQEQQLQLTKHEQLIEDAKSLMLAMKGRNSKEAIATALAKNFPDLTNQEIAGLLEE